MITRHVPAATGLTALALVLTLSGAPAAAQETSTAVAQPVVVTPSATASQFATVDELMAASGLGQTASTSGHVRADDGAGMTYSVQSSNVSGLRGNIAVPTADGQWAVPTGFDEHPSTRSDATAVEDEITRAQSFVNAGAGLVQDDARPSPLTSSGVVHSSQTAPYPITDVSFVGMTLMGWDYSHTTYVADENTRVGSWVDFGQTAGSELGQSHALARWFYAHGDLWLNVEDEYQRGDILFFSKQSPGGAGTTGDYFANVYHSAIYLGGGMIAHSSDSGTGVVVESLSSSLKQDLSLVARPSWQAAPASSLPETPAPGTSEPGVEVSEPAPANPAPHQSEAPAAPGPGPGSDDATIAIEDSVPGESESTESKDVIVMADPPARRRDGLLASTGGVGGVAALVATALLGIGALLRARRRSGEH